MMQSLRHSLANLEPVLIEPERAESFVEEFDRKVSLLNTEAASVVSFLESKSAPLIENPEEGIAVINLRGVIGSNLSPLEEAFGAVDVNKFADAVQAVAADKTIRGVVLNVDSPGGSVGGVQEAAEAVREMSAKKRTIAFVAPGASALSAAYWIASQATAGLVAAPSSKIGSVGVFVAYLDRSKQAEQAGLKVEVIRSGRFKAIGIPGTSLSDEQREKIQGEVNAIHRDFRTDVLAVRKKADPDDLEGQVFTGREAVSRFLATGSDRSLAGAINRLRRV